MRMIRSILLALLISPGFTLADTLPNLGSPERAALSPQAEAEMGQEFMIAVRNHFQLEQDPIITEYVNRIGRRLVAYSDFPSQHFYFFVIRNSAINAFAGPGGYIAVYTGTMIAVNNEAELASVMAHEMGHVTQHHIARGMAQQKRAQYQQIAGMIVGALIGAANPQAGAGIVSGSQALGAQQYLDHSQGFEKEADRVGIKTLAAAGYPPEAMPQFFKHLVNLEKFNPSNQATDMLRTHPLSATRLADAENRAAQYKNVKLRPQNDVELALVQGRLLAGVMPSNTTSLKGQYMQALALSKTHHAEQALTILKNLLQKYPGNTILKITESEIYFDSNQKNNALAILKNLYDNEPENPEIFLYYADMLIKMQKYQTAINVLKASGDYAQNDELYLYLYSEALGKAGQLSGAYELRAQLYELYGNTSGAKLQLTQALKYAKAYDQPRIQRELDALKKE